MCDEQPGMDAVKKVTINVEPPTIEQILLVQKISDEVYNNPEKYPVFSKLWDHQLMSRLYMLDELRGMFWPVLDKEQVAEMDKISEAVDRLPR